QDVRIFFNDANLKSILSARSRFGSANDADQDGKIVAAVRSRVSTGSAGDASELKQLTVRPLPYLVGSRERQAIDSQPHFW
ncbi:MAG: hypothetical protein M3466_05735, partial [Gemmatimonadota bacterium]|nr:hypothetical protein [Gemmatimonadota bacterium]